MWTFLLGAFDDIPLNVTVKNAGESAYETQLFIFHPATVPYNRIETEVSVKRTILCYFHCATTFYYSYTKLLPRQLPFVLIFSRKFQINLKKYVKVAEITLKVFYPCTISR